MSADDLCNALLENGASNGSVQHIAGQVEAMASRLEKVSILAQERANVLQSALIQTQGAQGAMDSLSAWLKDAENTFHNMRPVSLNREVLLDQDQRLKVLEADISSHEAGMESLNELADELSRGDPATARTTQQALDNLNTRYQNLADKCQTRRHDIDDILDLLTQFQGEVKALTEWITATTTKLESKDLIRMDNGTYTNRLNEVDRDRQEKLEEFEKIRDLGKALTETPQIGGASSVQEAMQALGQRWDALSALLSRRQNEASARREHAQRYEAIKDEVLDWLADMERRIDNLEPVAIDIDVIGKQIEELQVNVLLSGLTANFNFVEIRSISIAFRPAS